jgi:hypothetical protein
MPGRARNSASRRGKTPPRRAISRAQACILRALEY